MRISVWTAGLLLLFFIAEPSVRSADGSGQELRADTLSVWLFFRDHGHRTPRELDAALARAQEEIVPAALWRRARAGSATADLADLPVCERYLLEIARHGRIRVVSRWLNAASLRTTRSALPALRGLPFVRDVRPVLRGLGAGIDPATPTAGHAGSPLRLARAAGPDPAAGEVDFYGLSLFQLQEIGILEAHRAGYTGNRIPILMIDTGYMKEHESLRHVRVAGERDYIQGDRNTQDEPGDFPGQQDHGTLTWAACGANLPGMLIGPAYGAEFLLAKTEYVVAERRVEEDNYIAALEWADSSGVLVSSASLVFHSFDDGSGWGFPFLDGDTTPVTRAIDRAFQRGILCVNGIGNSGPGVSTLVAPSDADSMLACGAVNGSNQIASFSSRGPTADGRLKPEVVARGVGVWSAATVRPEAYAMFDGTSLSTPLVAGVAALVLEAHPEWTVAQAREAILATADRADRPDNTYGHGRVDAWKAIRSGPVVAPTPFDLLGPPSGEEIRVADLLFHWSRSRDLGGGPIRYEIWLDEDEAFDDPVVVSGIEDSLWAPAGELAAGRTYVWIVLAESATGHRRMSRQTGSIRTAPESNPPDGIGRRGGWDLLVAPHPARGIPRIRLTPRPGCAPGAARLSLFDAAGRRVWSRQLLLVCEQEHDVVIDRAGEGQSGIGSGVYQAVLETAAGRGATKLVWVR